MDAVLRRLAPVVASDCQWSACTCLSCQRRVQSSPYPTGKEHRPLPLRIGVPCRAGGAWCSERWILADRRGSDDGWSAAIVRRSAGALTGAMQSLFLESINWIEVSRVIQGG